MDDIRYNKQQEEQLAVHEGRCKRCGVCCGATGSDPCANLVPGPDNTYLCRVYATRLGSQITRSGKPFTCVPIRGVLQFGIPHEECGYHTG